jgi:hypothetical protein
MRFVVDHAEQQNQMILVTGETSVGRIKGIWKGAEPPVIGSGYHIELGMTFPCEIDISQEKQRAPYVMFQNDKVMFLGVCEEMDEDVYYLRFDIDWLEMLDINAVYSGKKAGDVVSFSVSIYDVEIYPYSL